MFYVPPYQYDISDDCYNSYKSDKGCSWPSGHSSKCVSVCGGGGRGEATDQSMFGTANESPSKFLFSFSIPTGSLSSPFSA